MHVSTRTTSVCNRKQEKETKTVYCCWEDHVGVLLLSGKSTVQTQWYQTTKRSYAVREGEEAYSGDVIALSCRCRSSLQVLWSVEHMSAYDVQRDSHLDVGPYPVYCR